MENTLIYCVGIIQIFFYVKVIGTHIYHLLLRITYGLVITLLRRLR